MNSRLLGIGALVLVTACAGSQAQRVQDARMAEIDAQTKARLDTVDQRADAQGDQIAQTGEQAQENIEGTSQPGAGARSDLSEIATERASYRNDATKRLDKLSIRLDAAREKVDVLGSKAPSSFQSDIETAVTEQKLLKQRVSELQASDPASWAADKETLEQRLDTLDRRITQLNDAISDV